MRAVGAIIGGGVLLWVALAAYGDCELNLTWDPPSFNNEWDNPANWGGVYYPGQTDRNASAILAGSALLWPTLQNNPCICSLTMGDNASLDLSGKTLTVTQTLSISGGSQATTVSITSSSEGGVLNADRIEITGGPGGKSLTLSGCTVRSGNYGSCP